MNVVGNRNVSGSAFERLVGKFLLLLLSLMLLTKKVFHFSLVKKQISVVADVEVQTAL